MQRCSLIILAILFVLVAPGAPPANSSFEDLPKAQTGLSQAVAQKLQPLRVFQPVQEYSISMGVGLSPGATGPGPAGALPSYTHLGTECGRMGPGQEQIFPRSGQVWVDLKQGDWAGMWFNLAGRAQEKVNHIDFLRCYPSFIQDKFQPRCVGVALRVQGKGVLKVEIVSPGERVLWEQTQEIRSEDQVRDLVFAFSPTDLREAKFLSWVAEPGARFGIASLGLLLEYPPMSFAQRIFLISYAKLARCYSPSHGLVKDRARSAAGEFDSIPASGLFCLATCAAWKMGIVDRSFALETLATVHRTVSLVPRSLGLLPHFVHEGPEGNRICPHTEYSTVDTSIYYHSMLLAAQMLSDQEVVAELGRAIREIPFDQLRDAQGFILHGLRDDGCTKLGSSWQDWGGETALVLLLERMAAGDKAPLKMSRSGKVFAGVGFISEIQSLFYPQFASDEPDALTGVNWLRARREELKEQMEYFPRTCPESPAARLGIFGLSAGEGCPGQGYAVNGTQMPNMNLIHPHYMLMSGLLRRQPEETYRLLQTMESLGLICPWGMVENVRPDLSEYLSWTGSLNASFESLGAYHLWAQETRHLDSIYQAAETCRPLREAIQAFYPRHDHPESNRMAENGPWPGYVPVF